MRNEPRCGATIARQRSRQRCTYAPVLALLAVMSLPRDSAAQAPTGGPPPGPVEASFSAGWLGGSTFGAAEANLRTRAGDDYLLFSTESRMRGTPAVEARASYVLTRHYAVEGRFAMSRPELRTSIAADIEGAADIDVAERIHQYTLEGALVVMLPGLRMGSLLPFASVGAGYLRQLHEGLTLVEEGVAYHGGGGARHAFFLRRQGLFTSAGIRGDVRLNILTGGVELGDGPRTYISAAGGFFVAF